MQARLNLAWSGARDSFWFLPALMTAGALALAAATLWLDNTYPLTYGLVTAGPDGAREVLTAIAGSTITVAATAFSVTVVALTLAASQFGSRVLVTFVGDRGNQVVLGTFIATFTYSTLALRSVRSSAPSEFVPHLSVTVALVLSLLSVAVLIYFIHHTAMSLSADHVVEMTGRRLDSALEHPFPAGIGSDAADGERPGPTFTQVARVPVLADQGGYIRSVSGSLVGMLQERGLAMELLVRPGDRVLPGSPLAVLHAADPVPEEQVVEMRGEFVVGASRSLVQDAELAAEQMVEIALRALSPGINALFTALRCADRLTLSLAAMRERPQPTALRRDAEGEARLLVRPFSTVEIGIFALDLLRPSGAGHLAMAERLLSLLVLLVEAAEGHEQAAQVRAAGARLWADLEQATRNPADLASLRAQYHHALRGAYRLDRDQSEQTA